MDRVFFPHGRSCLNDRNCIFALASFAPRLSASDHGPLLTVSLQPPGTDGRAKAIPHVQRGSGRRSLPAPLGLQRTRPERLRESCSGALGKPLPGALRESSQAAGLRRRRENRPRRGSRGARVPDPARRFGADQQMAAPPRLGAQPRARRCR